MATQRQIAYHKLKEKLNMTSLFRVLYGNAVIFKTLRHIDYDLPYSWELTGPAYIKIDIGTFNRQEGTVLTVKGIKCFVQKGIHFKWLVRLQEAGETGELRFPAAYLKEWDKVMPNPTPRDKVAFLI